MLAVCHTLGAARTGDERADCIPAARETMRRRERDTVDGAAVIARLCELGSTYTQIEQETGIPAGHCPPLGYPPKEA
jgi:hypothetical protein